MLIKYTINDRKENEIVTHIKYDCKCSLRQNDTGTAPQCVACLLITFAES